LSLVGPTDDLKQQFRAGLAERDIPHGDWRTKNIAGRYL
jgi:hypothetical protein